MSQQTPYYPVVPINMVQQYGQQHVALGYPVMAGQNHQAIPTAQASQLAANSPEIWQVQNHINAPAIISTNFGRYPKREIVANLPVAPIMRSDQTAAINAMVASLRQDYPAASIRAVKKPTCWDDLYFLWDAADIHLQGPAFLYYVMHRLGEENEELDRIGEAQNNAINEYAQEWVTYNRELVLNSVAGSMYGLFFSTPSEFDDLRPELKPILGNALETHRLRLLRDNSRNIVNPAAHTMLQHNSMPQTSHHQAPNLPHARAVSDKGDRLDQFGKRINRPNMPVVTAGQRIPTQPSRGQTELNGLGSAQAQSTSTLHGGRNLSMPLTLTTPSTFVNQLDLISALPQQPQTYDHFMEIQRNMTAGLGVSPNRPNNFRADNGFRNKARPRGHSIETPRNRRNQWTAPSVAHQNKFAHQPQHNNPQYMPGSKRETPPRAPQREPIYVRNLQKLQYTSGSSGDTSHQLIGNEDSVRSRMDLPNDARNHKNFQQSNINQSLDFGPMEGDANFQRRDDSCLYRYGSSSIPRNASGRTLYLRGPDLKMFYTHQLKELMSTVGNVVLIKFLLRPHNNGPVFVTFDTDVIAAAIKEFDGYKMPDGRLLSAGYPSESMRERSGSNSSYNSYGDNHARYMSNAGLDGRPYPRRSSISQHRPSRSQSGQSQFQFPIGNHIPPHNTGKLYPHTSTFQSNCSYPAPYAPGQHQQSPEVALDAAFSEVVQHERGISHFQQQMPLAAMKNRTNTDTTPYPRSYGRSQGESNRINTNPETGSATTAMSSLPENQKENSPIKRRFTGNTQSTPPAKDASRKSGGNHKKSSTSRRTTSTSTTPITTPTKPLHHVQLNKLPVERSVYRTSEVASPSETTTNSTSGPVLTMETTADPEPMNLEITKQVQVAAPVPLNPVSKVLPKLFIDTVAVKPSESVPQGKIKNSKKNKKSKLTSKVSLENGNSINNSIPAILSPADSESTDLSHVGEDRLFSEDSTRKPSVCSSIESRLSNPLNDSILQSQTGTNDAEEPVERERFCTKSLDNEVTKPIPTTNSIPVPTPLNVPAVKSSHKRTKAGGSLSKGRSVSTKDLKKLSQSNNTDNYDSSITPAGLVPKAEQKIVEPQGKNYRDGSFKPLGNQEQSKADLNKKNVDLPGNRSEQENTSVSDITTQSSEWPALTPSQSPPSSIADGKPPKVLSLPALSFRQTKAVILPALPLKPRRKS